MKLGVFCLALIGFGLVALGAVRTTAILAWDYPPEEVAKVTFNLYSTTNLSSTNWTVLTNMVGTNVVIPINPGMAFFFVTASNEFGESLPSNTVTATVARAIGTLKIK